jgi:hypothetical protein
MAAASATNYHDFNAPRRTAMLATVSEHIASAPPLPHGGYGSWLAPNPGIPFVSLILFHHFEWNKKNKPINY